MKILSLSLVVAAGAFAGCSSTANNTTANNANLRGTNTNTGYATNSNTTVKPTVPANPTVVGPASPATSSGPAKPGVSPTMVPKATKQS